MKKEESMESRIYDLMDWAAVEAVVYAEEDEPGSVLGPHPVNDGILVQAFFPGAENVSLRVDGGSSVPMVLEDEAGFFAVLLDGKTVPAYTFLVEDPETKKTREVRDPYAFPGRITEKEEARFADGTWYRAADKMGAHPVTLNGVDGVSFAVWAPNAIRVSVVGDFDRWDGRIYQMNRLPSGIFELFIPGVQVGSFYKYEIKTKSGLVYLKADPYANACQQLPEAASIVTDLHYDWKDGAWMEARKTYTPDARPVAIYEVHPGEWKKQADGTVFSYAQLAPELAAYVKKMGYTHVELTPVMEYPEDDSLGYATSGFFAPTSRYGTPAEFMQFIDTMHKEGIGVILDWVPSCFARGNDGLASFDGTCLYEHLDPKKGVHPSSGALLFNYGRGEVESFLSASALFWLLVYHADGLRINDLSTMLYLDYGRKSGQWIANMYGGNENLEAIRFLKRLNLETKKEAPGTMMIAEEETGYPEVTGSAEKEGLGFDYKWNNGCINDFVKYIQLDPLFRGSHQDDLTFSSVYMYSEKFLLALSHTLLTDGGKSFMRQMPGAKKELKFANLKLSYGYLLAHPGKKLIAMGQDFGQEAPLTPEKGVAWEELKQPLQEKMQDYFHDLLALYRKEPALYELDENPEGFEWISNLDWERNLLVFLRKSMRTEETLLIVANFSNVEYDNFMIGVPFPGKYKEIFNSDDEKYGGSGAVNRRVKLSRAVEQDERRDSIKINVAPLAVQIFRFTEPVARKSVDAAAGEKQMAASKKSSAVEKTAARKRAAVTKKAAAAKRSAGKKHGTSAAKKTAAKKAVPKSSETDR